MYRLRRINHHGIHLTQDTIDALDRLRNWAIKVGRWDIRLLGPKLEEEPAGPLSMRDTGREVHLRFSRSDVEDPQVALNAAWSCAVPLGFTPWLRHLLTGEGDTVFHYLGPWQPVYDRLLAEGRGHLAWPSVCAAAQADVGVWKGGHEDAVFAQAQLHRIGRNCGAVDGVIGTRAKSCIESLGLRRSSLVKVVQHLRVAEPDPVAPRERSRGHLVLPGHNLTLGTFGGVKAIKSDRGAALVVDGPGRLIVDIGE